MGSERVTDRGEKPKDTMQVWWITTDAFPRGGRRVLGPFATREGAFQARQYVEGLEGHSNYWIEEEVMERD